MSHHRQQLRCIAHIAILVVVTTLLASCESQETLSAPPPWFENTASTSGISFQFVSGYGERPLLPEIVGGGVAIADFNGDSSLDLYFVQAGFNLDIGRLNTTEPIPPNELYFNEGNLKFTKAEQIGDAVDRSYGMGAYAGDYDNDGDLDLYLTNVGPNKLLSNDGNGVFHDVTEQAKVGDSSWSTAASFVDFNTDGHLDIYVSNYIDWSPESELACSSKGQLTYCLPTSYQSEAQDRLYQNNGDGTFNDITLEAGLTTDFGPGLGIVTADFDLSGTIDVFVANDTMVNQLWLQQSSFKFLNQATSWGSAVDDHGFPKAGMGIDTADIDHDGDFDVVVVNFEGQTDSFHQNEGTYYLDVTSRFGLGVGSRRYTRFGVVLADFDNDGFVDMYQANGKVDGVAASPDDPFKEPNTLFQGLDQDGRFRFSMVPPPGGVSEPLIHTSRGTAVADLDNDGGLDLVVVNKDNNVYLLKNVVANRNNWIRVRPVLKGNQPAIGAVVKTTLADKVLTGVAKTSGSYLASNDPSVHFGLGKVLDIESVGVHWLDGLKENFGSFEVNQEIVLVRGQGAPIEDTN